MHDQVTELAQRGKALLPEDRSRLVDILLESLHEPAIAEVEAAWGVRLSAVWMNMIAGKPRASMSQKFSPRHEASPGDQAALETKQSGGLK